MSAPAQAPAPRPIFINYRRTQDGTPEQPGEDVGGHAGRLYDRLRQWFDPDQHLFYDLASLQMGDYFPPLLQQAVTHAQIVLVVIGPGWEAEILRRDQSGLTDWVCRELEAVWQRRQATPADEQAQQPTAIPVLVGRQQPPDWSQLPAPLPHFGGFHHQTFGLSVASWDSEFIPLRDKLLQLTGLPLRFRYPTDAIPPYQVLEHAISPHFQDPNGHLVALHQHLRQGAVAVVARAAVYGMGGLGKTQLALKYSADHCTEYAGVWWFRAENPGHLQADALACCTALGIAVPTGEPPSLALKHWLDRQSAPWLLVYDNAEKLDDLRPHLPNSPLHHVLITSRNPNWAGVAQELPLQVWTPEQGADFLQQRLPLTLQSTPRGQLIALSQDLGGLPLALEQAAGYLGEAACSVAVYRQCLANVDTEGAILDEGEVATGYELKVIATLTLAHAQLDPAAQQLLGLCAFAAPDPIPERWFREAAEHLPEVLQTAAHNDMAWDKVVATLRRYGLLERLQIPSLDRQRGAPTDAAEPALNLHRLTQAAVRSRHATAAHAQAWLAVLRQICPKEANLPQHWPTYARLAPHGETLLRFWQAQGLDVAAVGWLLDRVASYLQYGPALYPQAAALHQQVLTLRRRVLGEEHPNTLTSMNNLAETLRAQGDLLGARALQEQVLAIRRRVLGEEHPNTLTSMNNLAGTLRAQGDLPGARALEEQVLSIRRRVLGEEHPDTLASMNNLAGTLRAQGDLSGARALHEQELAICRRVLGEEHPDTLISMSNLAITLRAQGDLPGARALHEQVLTIRRRVLGEEHPDTLTSMNNLASTLRAQGDLPDARALQEQVLAIRRRVLGDEHPSTLISRNNLAYTLWQMGDHISALDHMRAAAEGRLRKLGAAHADTLASQQALQRMTAALKDQP